MDLLGLKLLILLMAANGAPILARKLLVDRWCTPIDGGRTAADGGPWLGPSKTWRGLAASLLTTPPLALLLELPPLVGLVMAGGAMAGDLLSSFIKRRLGIPPSGMAFGLDQIPEALTPLLLLMWFVPLSAQQLLIILSLFIILELILSQILFALNIRKRPY